MSMPKKKSRTDRARDIALYRYSLIRSLADAGLSPTERGRLVRELARRLMPNGGPVVILWSWLEPLDPVSHRWYWLMRQIPGAQIGPEPNDALAMAAAAFPRRQSWTRIRTRHRYTTAGLHDFLRSSSYWRPESVEMVTHSQQLVERFAIENSQATTDVQLTFREVGFLGYVER